MEALSTKIISNFDWGTFLIAVNRELRQSGKSLAPFRLGIIIEKLVGGDFIREVDSVANFKGGGVLI